MADKKKIVVLFGGQSSEHEVSCVSVRTVVGAMDPEKYEPVLIGITKEGHWIFVESVDRIADGSWINGTIQAVVSPDATEKSILLIEGSSVRRIRVDAAFPVLHGKYGEDGTIQGLFELAQIPYVGCGVLSSAVSMDKVYTKQLVSALPIRQARYVWMNLAELEDMDACVDKVERTLSYPVFVKPSKAGSSCGVSQAADRGELIRALHTASEVDSRLLVEESIRGRELECAVLGILTPSASDVGEILAAESFYTYDAKYNNPDSQTDLHPDIPEEKREEIRKDAREIFRAVDGFGLARVDFFLEEKTGEVIFNEINTMPGFTSISMYPMLWAEKGVSRTDLVDRLITMAFERK